MSTCVSQTPVHRLVGAREADHAARPSSEKTTSCLASARGVEVQPGLPREQRE